MNKKGFISTSLVYSMFIVFILLTTLILALYTNNRNLLSKEKEEIKNVLNNKISLNVYDTIIINELSFTIIENSSEVVLVFNDLINEPLDSWDFILSNEVKNYDYLSYDEYVKHEKNILKLNQKYALKGASYIVTEENLLEQSASEEEMHFRPIIIIEKNNLSKVGDSYEIK